MKTLLSKLSSYTLSIGIIVAWFVGSHYLVAESSEVLITGIVYIITAPLIIVILDYTIE